MISTNAIVMSVKPIQEHDLLVELLTLTQGRIRAFVKYAQSSKPRFGGRLDTFNFVNVMLIESRSSYKLRDVNTLNTFGKIKTNYNTLSVAYSIIEVVRTMTQMGVENRSLFDHTYSALDQLNQSVLGDQFLSSFYYLILKTEGVISDSMILNEKDYKKMIESYTGIKLRNSL
jgi:DNA repair protein RecO